MYAMRMILQYLKVCIWFRTYDKTDNGEF